MKGLIDEADSILASRLARALECFAASEPRAIADTATSRVYRVRLHGGETAALKLLKPAGVEDEARGAELLRWFGGDGAARLLDATEDAHLVEWADGPELAALCHEGRDDEATAILCRLVGRLHAPREAAPPPQLMDLEHRFAALLALDLDTLRPVDAPLLEAAQSQARALLASMTDRRQLHGDLHHFNVLRSARGWLTIDPKGLIGDPAYDVANLFLNPLDMPELIGSPARIERVASALVSHCGFDADRVLRFAVAHAGLTAAWRLADGDSAPWGLAVMPALLAVLGER